MATAVLPLDRLFRMLPCGLHTCSLWLLEVCTGCQLQRAPAARLRQSQKQLSSRSTMRICNQGRALSATSPLGISQHSVSTRLLAARLCLYLDHNICSCCCS